MKTVLEYYIVSTHSVSSIDNATTYFRQQWMILERVSGICVAIFFCMPPITCVCHYVVPASVCVAVQFSLLTPTLPRYYPLQKEQWFPHPLHHLKGGAWCKIVSPTTLTLNLLMSTIVAFPSNARNTNVYFWVTFVWLCWQPFLSIWLHNVSTLNESRKQSCVIFVCKHLVIYHRDPNYTRMCKCHKSGQRTVQLVMSCI